MRCDNCFCIYQSQGKCTIDEINIDGSGMCMDCIYPDIDEKILQETKMKLLKKYEKFVEESLY